MIIVKGNVIAQGTTVKDVGPRMFKTLKLVDYLARNTLEPTIAAHLHTYLHEEGLDMQEAGQALACVILTEAANVIISLTYSQGLSEATHKLTEEEVSELKLQGLEDARKFFEAYTMALDPATLATVYGVEVDEDDLDTKPTLN